MRYELKPLGVGATLDQAIQIFRDRFGLLLLILVVLRIPSTAIIQYFVFSSLGKFPVAPTDAEMNEFLSRFFQLYLYVFVPAIAVDFLLVTPITNIAVIYVAARTYLGEPVSFWDALRVVPRRYIPFVWTSFLFSVMLFVGSLCFVLPGIIFLFLFTVSPTVAVLERQAGFGALNRSFALMQSGGLTHYLVLCGLLATGFAIQVGINACANLIPEMHLEVVAGATFGSVSYAFLVVAQVVFYYSCRCRLDGFDLLHLARIVAETPVEGPILPAQG